jgi:DNA-binding NtrC family response regulator
VTEAKVQALLVDDDPDFVNDFLKLLPDSLLCSSASSAAEALKELDCHRFDVLFLDIDLGSGENGMQFLKRLKSDFPYLPVIMVTGDRRTETVVTALRSGAADYIGKTPDMRKLHLSLERALAEINLRRRIDVLQKDVDSIFGELVGESAAMKRVKDEMVRLAHTSSNVFITGPTGTGKELVARGIHRLSDRKEHPFIAINCAALSRELVESELFGHEKGSFTGAVSKRLGKFEVVGDGTLFLDEITEISQEVQAKLLRVVQEREFERVGGNCLIPFEGRLIASSNRIPQEAIAANRLREDLYYRISVTSIELPPLEERRDDIPLLVEHFVCQLSAKMKKHIERVTDDGMQVLTSGPWPGNVRELHNCVERAIVHCEDSVLDAWHFDRPTLTDPPASESYEAAKKRCLMNFQREYISALIKKNDGNLSQTAREMGVSRQGLVKMIESCGLA